MPVYTFYPQSADGAAKTFRALDLSSDEAARDAAKGVLEEHRSAEAVAIWQDDDFIGMVRTEAADARDRSAGPQRPAADTAELQPA